MEVKYEIRVRKAIDGGKYSWKLMKCYQYGEEIINLGYEDTLDLAYKHAKMIYEALAE